MYALEKRLRDNTWRRYAVCGRRKPLEKVAAGLNTTGIWRVVSISVEIDTVLEFADAA